MESGRQTRRKAQTQSTSFQPSGALKTRQPTQEKLSDLSSPILSTENSSEEKLQELKQSRKGGQKMTENMTSAQEALEMSSELQKQAGRSETGHHEADNKAMSQKRDRKMSGDSGDVSNETKRQFEMLFEVAQALASKGDYQQAIHIYHKIVKINEKSTAAWIAIGHCHAMLGDNFKALSSYQQALSITSDSQRDDQLWYGIGLLYQKTGDWKNAETSFKNALKLNPKSSIKGEILYNLGVIMKNKGQPKEGIQLLMNSITAGSFSIDKMIEVLCTVGQAQEELSEVNEAMKTYRHALTLDENNLKALKCAGWLCFQLDRTSEAMDYLTKASLIDENDPIIWFMQARCFLKLRQHGKAYDYLSKCITKDQANSMYWNSLGILFGEMQQLKSSHECFSNALKFGISIAENYFNMGCLYELCSQFSDSIAMYDKAIELQPGFQLAYTRKLGVHFAQAENKEDALPEVQFKHHKFALNLDKDMQKSKPLFSFSQPATNYTNAENDPGYFHGENYNQQKQKQKQLSDIIDISSFQPIIASNHFSDADLISMKNQLLKQNSLSSGLSESVISGNFPFKGQYLGSDLSLLRGNNMLNGDYNLESLHNIKEGSDKHLTEALGKLNKPSKIKGSKSSTKENFLKDNTILDLQGNPGEFSKINMPIAQRPNQVKSQPKTGFKLSQAIREGEEDPAPQKKVKTGTPSSGGSRSPHNEMQEVGTKRVPSLVLTSSTLSK